MTKQLNVFSGCTQYGSELAAFQDKGHNITTLGIEPGVDILQDIRTFSTKKHYDFMIFHPPCNCFSVAALNIHWKNGLPDKETREAIEIVKACIRVIEESNPTYWMIENSRNMLRSLPFMQDLTKKYHRSTITFCQYGDTNQKPTDLWHNLPTFHPKKCKAGRKCHTASPRGTSPKGTLQSKSKKERAIIPYNLSTALCISVEKAVTGATF